MNRSDFKDKAYYDVLRVYKSSSRSEILKAYKMMCMETHPDKGGDDELQQMVNEARAVLTDDIKRIDYDAYLERMGIQDGQGENTAKYFDKVLTICQRNKPLLLEVK